MSKINYFMCEEQQEAFNAVSELNDIMLDRYEGDGEQPIFTFMSAGWYYIIGVIFPSNDDCVLPEMEIFNSVNDNREFYEESNSYEPFIDYIRNKFNLMIDKMASYKL